MCIRDSPLSLSPSLPLSLSPALSAGRVEPGSETPGPQFPDLPGNEPRDVSTPKRGPEIGQAVMGGTNWVIRA
eukprot:15171310-Alexandrium_andersonii.AAC.1